MKKKILLLLFVAYAMLFTMSTYAQKSLPTISITTSTPLNPRQKVAAHMKTIGYDGPIGMKQFSEFQPKEIHDRDTRC